MADSLKLAEMQRTSIEFERQRHLANWFIKSSPHMATPPTTALGANGGNAINGTGNSTTTSGSNTPASTPAANQQSNAKHSVQNTNSNPVFFLMSSNGNTGAVGPHNGKHHNLTSATSPAIAAASTPLGLMHGEGRKPKLRRFNSHDTSSFSASDFENARLARRNENEMKQRLQRRLRMSTNGYGGFNGATGLNGSACGSQSGDYSTGDSKASKYSNESQTDPLPVEAFIVRYALPRVARVFHKAKFSDETLQSSSSNGSSTVTTNSTASGNGLATGTSSSTNSSSGNLHNSSHNSSTSGSGKRASHSGPSATNGAGNQDQPQAEQGELFLLYRLIRQRHIFHGHNAKTTATNRKKGVLIPQEFPGYFSLINDKGLPTATLYTSLIQLVRDRVCKFVSCENMTAFTESQPSNSTTPNEGCLPIYTQPTPQNRPQYVKTTARGGQVFKLLAVFEDGKQDHNAMAGGNHVTAKSNNGHGREKDKGRYAQLLNDNRQVLYVSLSTKGKFYEIEKGVPQILQKNGYDVNKKANPDCVHRITTLITPNKELPITLRYISGPNGCTNTIPENICITKISTENIIMACPIEDVEVQCPLQLRKLHLTKEMNVLKCTLGFESEQRMLANPNVQNILKFCQFNCDQFLKMVEIEVLNRPERSGSKSRVEGLKILKPLHLPKLLRREKTSISAHEKEDSIIFLTKTDLANLEAKDQVLEQSNGANRISEKMKVFQSTKKKWFRKGDKHGVNSLTSLDLDVQAKRMSMERYSDMSKLLQERFGDKTNLTQQEQESVSEPSGNSEIGCSDTETTTLATIEEKLKKFGRQNSMEHTLQKSMSLQDIELIAGHGARKPDLLTDAISEAGTDVEDVENRAPLQQSFITEKLYNEFHVKTRQYSKSSSSLHQLLNFSLPQKMQGHENKRTLAQLKQKPEKRFDFNIGEPVTGRRAAGGFMASSANGNYASNSQNTSLISPMTPTSLIEDDLPYSSVRDSLILSSDDSGAEYPTGYNCHALNMIDYTKENIYAEICHDASALGGVPNSHTRDTFSAETHSTQISSDDYGDYASLSCSSQQQSPPYLNGASGNAISRVQINCTSSPVSYHTVYLGEEPLGEHYLEKRKQDKQRDRAHITTVELEGISVNNAADLEEAAAGGVGTPAVATNNGMQGVDNIYNTLK